MIMAPLLLSVWKNTRAAALNRIDTIDDIRRGLKKLVAIDPRLAPVAAIAGELPLRRSPPGFASLVEIIVSQQVSTASAGAIFGRLSRLIDPLTPGAMLAAGEDIFRVAGLSRPKQRTMLAIARAVADDGLDLHDLCALGAQEAIGRLTPIHGIGPWTAQIYLLFCAGHGDIFPERDVALQAAVGDALDLKSRPGEKELARIAESWSPHRGVAARLFWAYYRQMRGREGVVGIRADAKAAD